MFIPDPDADFLPIPDPGVKKALDPGSGSSILGKCHLKNLSVKEFCGRYLSEFIDEIANFYCVLY